MSVYDYENAVDEILDNALNELSAADYEKLLDGIPEMIAERES